MLNISLKLLHIYIGFFFFNNLLIGRHTYGQFQAHIVRIKHQLSVRHQLCPQDITRTLSTDMVLTSTELTD